MSKSVLYKELKKAISAIKEVKYVGLFNSQFTQSGKHDHPNYPAVYIQFAFDNFADEANMGVQRYNAIVTLHIAFESYKIDAIEVLDIEEKINQAVYLLSCTPDPDNNYFGKMRRTGERMSADHDVLQVHEIDYTSLIRDYSAYKLTKKTLTLTPNITTSVVDEIT